MNIQQGKAYLHPSLPTGVTSASGPAMFRMLRSGGRWKGGRRCLRDGLLTVVYGIRPVVHIPGLSELRVGEQSVLRGKSRSELGVVEVGLLE